MNNNIAYKTFNEEYMSRIVGDNTVYEEGKIYTLNKDEKLNIGIYGYHFCLELYQVFKFNISNQSQLAEIEILDEYIYDEIQGCTYSFKIKKYISFDERRKMLNGYYCNGLKNKNFFKIRFDNGYILSDEKENHNPAVIYIDKYIKSVLTEDENDVLYYVPYKSEISLQNIDVSDNYLVIKYKDNKLNIITKNHFLNLHCDTEKKSIELEEHNNLKENDVIEYKNKEVVDYNTQQKKYIRYVKQDYIIFKQTNNEDDYINIKYSDNGISFKLFNKPDYFLLLKHDDNLYIKLKKCQDMYKIIESNNTNLKIRQARKKIVEGYCIVQMIFKIITSTKEYEDEKGDKQKIIYREIKRYSEITSDITSEYDLQKYIEKINDC